MSNSSSSDVLDYESFVQGLLSPKELHVIQCRLNNKTLEEVGTELDLTRERIRQIQAGSIRKLRRYKQQFMAYLGMIEDGLDGLGGILAVENATDSLCDRGIINQSIFRNVTTLFSLAHELGVDTRYHVYGDFVATQAAHDEYIRKEKRRQEVISRVNKVMKETCGIISAEHPSVSSVISLTDLEVLIEGAGHDLALINLDGSKWLALVKGKFHIETQALKIFCICQECNIRLLGEQLHRSIYARAYEGRGEINPQVIAEWMRISGKFEIDDELVSCSNSGQLSYNESIVAKKLAERDSWMYTELCNELEGELTKESLNRILGYSPIVVCDQKDGRRSYRYSLLSKVANTRISLFDHELARPAVHPQQVRSDNPDHRREPPSQDGSIEAPNRRENSSTEFIRSKAVSDYILENAAGICECCQNTAPFLKEDQKPYLEIHHVKMLSSGGSDTISNTIAVCPNCHRELHHGINREILKTELYMRIARLIEE